MGDFTQAEQQATLDARFGGTDYAGYSINGTSEFSGVARTAVTWAAATAANPSLKRNSGALTSAAATAAGTVTHFAVFSAATGGTQRTVWKALASSVPVNVGGRVSWAVGDLSISLP